jgi:hypothetical protein
MIRACGSLPPLCDRFRQCSPWGLGSLSTYGSSKRLARDPVLHNNDRPDLDRRKRVYSVTSDCQGAVSSAVEHYTDTVGVTGSNPVPRTICHFLTGLD